VKILRKRWASTTMTGFKTWLSCFCIAWHSRDRGGTVVTSFQGTENFTFHILLPLVTVLGL
jgi:hypothetical protein